MEPGLRQSAQPREGSPPARGRRDAHVRRVLDRRAPHAGTHARSLLLRDGGHDVRGRPRLRRLDRSIGLPELFAACHAREPRVVPHARRRDRRAPGARVAHDRRARTRVESLPGGSHLMDLRPPRGTLDLLPPKGSQMRALYDRAAELARLHGYRYVETPVFEATELFARTSGESSDVVTKEMYTFEDRKGRSLTLRPEGTAPVMRAYLAEMQAQPSPFKVYYLTHMYRYARPQEGRYREHRQFGIEVFGTEDPGADAEVIAVGDAYLRSLGLSRIELQLNSIGDEVCRPAYRDELTAFLRANRDRLSDEHRDRFEDNPLRVLDCKDDACRAVAKDAPKIIDRLCDACRAHFDGVQAVLKDAGLSWGLEPTLVRGLDFYTRTAFEFVSPGLSPQQGTLFGGGRYDGRS